MEAFSTLLALCEGKTTSNLSPVDFPNKGPVMRRFDVFFVVSLNIFSQTVELLVGWDAMKSKHIEYIPRKYVYGSRFLVLW